MGMDARFWDGDSCSLCPHNCRIPEGKKGVCRVRKNIDGQLVSLVYGKPVSVNIDPIEKKPLYHFLPGSSSFSVGTAGCNLSCPFCQNCDISCAEPEAVNSIDMLPEEVVGMAKSRGCQSISYTYNEPSIFIEYALDCARLARKAGLKNILVTNGYINEEPALEFCKYMDAANVDLKAFNDAFYKMCGGKLKPVLNTLKLYSSRMWVEVTNLVIDGKNDSIKEIRSMAKWLSSELGRHVPLHFSRAFPMFRMADIMPTPEKTLRQAQKIAGKYLDYVYIGNTGEAANTLCPACGNIVISRKNYQVVSHLESGMCRCGHKIPGVL